MGAMAKTRKNLIPTSKMDIIKKPIRLKHTQAPSYKNSHQAGKTQLQILPRIKHLDKSGWLETRSAQGDFEKDQTTPSMPYLQRV